MSENNGVKYGLLTALALGLGYYFSKSDNKVDKTYFEVAAGKKRSTNGWFQHKGKLQEHFPEITDNIINSKDSSIVIRTEIFESGVEMIDTSGKVGIPMGWDLVKDVLRDCEAFEKTKDTPFLSRAIQTCIAGNERFSATPYPDGNSHSIGFGFYCTEFHRELWNKTLGENAPDFDKAMRGDKSISITAEQATKLMNAKIAEFKNSFYITCNKYGVDADKLPANILTCCITQFYQNPAHLRDASAELYQNLDTLTKNPQNYSAREYVVNHMMDYLCSKNSKNDGLPKRGLIIANIALHNSPDEVQKSPVTLGDKFLLNKIEGILENAPEGSKILVIGENPLKNYLETERDRTSLAALFQNSRIRNFVICFSDGLSFLAINGRVSYGTGGLPSNDVTGKQTEPAKTPKPTKPDLPEPTLISPGNR